MEAYLSYGGLPPAYRCNVEVNWTYEEWLEQGEQRVPLGVGTLIFGVICIFLYIPCCLVLLQKDLRCVTAYKMLFLVSICQIISLFINSVIAGIFFIEGVVYCNYPNLNYLVGCVVMLTWACICITCFTLSTSRLVDLWSPSIHDALFGGKRVTYSFVIIFAYSMIFYFYAKPTAFNSKELAWIFDPIVYPDGSHFMDYACYITVANNEGTVLLTFGVTLLFIASFAYKSARYKFKMSSSQKQLFVQSSFSSLSSLTTASIYVSFQFVSAGRWFSYMGTLTWQIASAGELVLFLFINQTIRNRVLVILRLRRSTVASVSNAPSHSKSALQSSALPPIAKSTSAVSAVSASQI